MGLIAYLTVMFSGLGQFFAFCRDMFDALPFVIKILICFVFGAFLVFALLRMIIRVGGGS